MEKHPIHDLQNQIAFTQRLINDLFKEYRFLQSFFENNTPNEAVCKYKDYRYREFMVDREYDYDNWRAEDYFYDKILPLHSALRYNKAERNSHVLLIKYYKKQIKELNRKADAENFLKKINI